MGERTHHVRLYSSFEDLVAITSNKSTLTDSSPRASLCSTRKVVQQMEPSVVVHLSDEHGASPEYLSLADEVSVMLRQYLHAKYGPVPQNLHQIPSGYMAEHIENFHGRGRAYMCKSRTSPEMVQVHKT